ncbi:hypothetical protein [Halobacterium rubrum]|uniref:hypothetical protein n=1 Tax=Halobacterium TaxID=2239 RepID=UPI001F17F85C|nr:MULTISPECIES: hypothetical protein [Halobacterium]MDH5021053.1 hypothetical protein [Halobacterium rubrum]
MRETSPLDRSMDALAASTRRQLLATLHDSAPPVGIAVAEVVEESAQSNELHHVHIPKLERYGYVEVTHGEELLYRGPRFDEVADVMRVVEANASKLPGGWP